ncbi:dnaJ homolog subfamily C member 27-like, partial [Cyanistes caeruleus]|uniref:dnaJ homolog subfamily C member 27-like n=1 Tax=Cyanistes caeruleus TaxID=156563 RepID=UPI000CDA36D6
MRGNSRELFRRKIPFSPEFGNGSCPDGGWEFLGIFFPGWAIPEFRDFPRVQIRDREIKVNIFDMAGHPFFYEVRNEFYKDTQGVLLVYDVGSKESFDSLDSWLAEMRQELGPHASLDNVVVVVCANKVPLPDLPRAPSRPFPAELTRSFPR